MEGIHATLITAKMIEHQPVWNVAIVDEIRGTMGLNSLPVSRALA